MSPEWMIALDAATSRHDPRRKTLADPLERPEWQGHDFLSRLFARLLGGQEKSRRNHRAYRANPLTPARFHQ